ncbi:NEDD8-conjugating protein ubc12 [Bulinus truncatus]|nr:NEDD8-conjugating protein ubc12 [Bulinus truncatus]
MVSNFSNILKELTTLNRNINKLTDGQVIINEINNSVTAGNLLFFVQISPKEGHYHGATYLFKIEVPASYPTKAPYVNCLNKVYHPNIDIEDGGVCVNLIDRDWQPGVGLDGCIMAVLFIFYNPNFLDALSTAFDGCPMDENEFHYNVRASLRGEAIEGVLFDKLIDVNCQTVTENCADQESKTIPNCAAMGIDVTKNYANEGRTILNCTDIGTNVEIVKCSNMNLKRKPQTL